MEELSLKELESIKHDDLRKFARDAGIEVPEEITTKKALVPYLFEKLNEEKDQQESQEQIIDQGDQLKEESTEHDNGVNQSEEESGDEPQTKDDPQDEEPPIEIAAATGRLVYDRKTHSAKMIPYE
ncbi:MAG: hypothetical protein ACLTXM_04140 [Enterococcus sp.]